MTDQPVIVLENVGKHFAFTTERPRSILESIVNLTSRSKHSPDQAKELWAVKDVSFSVMPGQSVGLIGRNGSGKSSILKLIARILRPNTGRIVVNGRVSALLELGAGFHQDLTGRENIFLNASVLGLSRTETEKYFQSIVEFSELGDFIDMPVKHYSSGMFMRLGFSVAIHVDPDILIVDEILAVGDQAFQTKCIDYIYDMKRRGVTILMVSHNMSMMRKLCSHLIWIEKGKVQKMGPAEDVAEAYLGHSYGKVTPQSARLAGQTAPDFERWGSREIEITAVRLLNEDGAEQQTFRVGESMTIEMHYFAFKPIVEPEFGLAIFRQDGLHITGPNTQIDKAGIGTVTGAGIIRYYMQRLPLLPAQYHLTVAIHDSRQAFAYDYHKEAYPFRMVDDGSLVKDGIIGLDATWEWVPQEVTESAAATSNQITHVA